jgi:hypothetical protein
VHSTAVHVEVILLRLDVDRLPYRPGANPRTCASRVIYERYRRPRDESN